FSSVMISTSRFLTMACATFVLLTWSKSASAAITVQTSDGRELTGEVDEQTDARHLWIRQENEQIQLTTAVPWKSIVSATDGDEILSLEELPNLLRGRITNASLGFLVQQAVYQSPVDSSLTIPPGIHRKPQRLPRVHSIDVEAFLVNLDRDVEPDGLELLVAALDEHGQPVPVKGSLYVRLWGERMQPHGSLVRYENLQTWNQPVVPLDFKDGVASFAMRFRTVRPEFDWRLHSDALINVRLGVVGQGNYEASVPVAIRKFNPVRDRLQLTRGTRFFPGEVTQQRRRWLPYRSHSRGFTTR
ncbi:MAG: hypothetical protein ACR2NM_01180, partial [Bythopirellula sp.]